MFIKQSCELSKNLYFGEKVNEKVQNSILKILKVALEKHSNLLSARYLFAITTHV